MTYSAITGGGTMSDVVGTVRHRGGVYAMMTVEGEWFTTHPVDGLRRWFGDVESWDVAFHPHRGLAG